MTSADAAKRDTIISQFPFRQITGTWISDRKVKKLTSANDGITRGKPDESVQTMFPEIPSDRHISKPTRLVLYFLSTVCIKQEKSRRMKKKTKPD